MLHYVQEVVANYVCLLFGAEQVVCIGFLKLFHGNQLPAVAKNDMRAVRVNQNQKLWSYR